MPLKLPSPEPAIRRALSQSAPYGRSHRALVEDAEADMRTTLSVACLLEEGMSRTEIGERLGLQPGDMREARSVSRRAGYPAR
jgi:hypothetical protein